MAKSTLRRSPHQQRLFASLAEERSHPRRRSGRDKKCPPFSVITTVEWDEPSEEIETPDEAWNRICQNATQNNDSYEQTLTVRQSTTPDSGTSLGRAEFYDFGDFRPRSRAQGSPRRDAQSVTTPPWSPNRSPTSPFRLQKTTWRRSPHGKSKVREEEVGTAAPPPQLQPAGTGALQAQVDHLAAQLESKQQEVMQLRRTVAGLRETGRQAAHDYHAEAIRTDATASELQLIRKDNARLRERYEEVMEKMLHLKSRLLQAEAEVKHTRAKELNKLRESVGRSARSPIRDRSHSQSRGRATPLRRSKSRPHGEVVEEPSDRRIAELQAEVAALHAERQTLQRQNDGFQRDLKALQEDKDALTKLLVDGGGVKGGAVVTVEGAALILAETHQMVSDVRSAKINVAPSSEFVQNLMMLAHQASSLSNCWSHGGAEHIAASAVCKDGLERLGGYLQVEESRINTLRNLLGKLMELKNAVPPSRS